MRIEDTVVVITGASSGVGRALAFELARHNVHGLALADARESVGEVAQTINKRAGDWVCFDFCGDPMDAEFCEKVFRETARHCGTLNVCVPIPAARSSFTEAQREEADFICPVRWGQALIDFLAEGRVRKNLDRWRPGEALEGMVVFVSPDTLPGHAHGKVSAATKIEARKATMALAGDAHYYGVGCATVLAHTVAPTNCGIAGAEFKNLFPSVCVVPHSSAASVAKAICFVIENTLWDARPDMAAGVFPDADRHFSERSSPYSKRFRRE